MPYRAPSKHLWIRLDGQYQRMNGYGATGRIGQGTTSAQVAPPMLSPNISDVALAWAAEYYAHYRYELEWPNQVASLEHDH